MEYVIESTGLFVEAEKAGRSVGTSQYILIHLEIFKASYDLPTHL